MKDKFANLWNIQCEMDRLNRLLSDEMTKMYDIISSMTDEELREIIQAFYERTKSEVEIDVPDLVIYALHELEDREGNNNDE